MESRWYWLGIYRSPFRHVEPVRPTVLFILVSQLLTFKLKHARVNIQKKLECMLYENHFKYALLLLLLFASLCWRLMQQLNLKKRCPLIYILSIYKAKRVSFNSANFTCIPRMCSYCIQFNPNSIGGKCSLMVLGWGGGIKHQSLFELLIGQKF